MSELSFRSVQYITKPQSRSNYGWPTYRHNGHSMDLIYGRSWFEGALDRNVRPLNAFDNHICLSLGRAT